MTSRGTAAFCNTASVALSAGQWTILTLPADAGTSAIDEGIVGDAGIPVS